MSDWLVALPCRVGQIFVIRESDGRIVLCHRDNAGQDELITYTSADDAMELARYDDAGAYRPLKTAPNLRHGWRLVLTDLEQAGEALDHFYPGRAAAWRAWNAGTLRTTPLRETLGRQSGMYRIAGKITGTQADEVIASFCRSESGCLRTILWKQDATGSPASTLLPASKFDPAFDQTGRGEETRPLLCQEACNLLVAEMRKKVMA